MPNYWPNVWTDLRAIVHATWPEVGTNLREIQAKRLNWANLLKSGKIVPPYVVLQVHAEETEEWGLQNDVYRGTVTLTYIDALAGADTAATLEAKLYAMQTAVRTKTDWLAIQVLSEGLVLNTSDDEEVNVSMLEADMPLQAGALSFVALVGETVTV